jgi:hypothetical protein
MVYLLLIFSVGWGELAPPDLSGMFAVPVGNSRSNVGEIGANVLALAEPVAKMKGMPSLASSSATGKTRGWQGLDLFDHDNL